MITSQLLQKEISNKLIKSHLARRAGDSFYSCHMKISDSVQRLACGSRWSPYHLQLIFIIFEIISGIVRPSDTFFI